MRIAECGMDNGAAMKAKLPGSDVGAFLADARSRVPTVEHSYLHGTGIQIPIMGPQSLKPSRAEARRRRGRTSIQVIRIRPLCFCASARDNSVRLGFAPVENGSSPNVHGAQPDGRAARPYLSSHATGRSCPHFSSASGIRSSGLPTFRSSDPPPLRLPSSGLRPQASDLKPSTFRLRVTLRVERSTLNVGR
jgi:hypothetical protein